MPSPKLKVRYPFQSIFLAFGAEGDGENFEHLTAKALEKKMNIWRRRRRRKKLTFGAYEAGEHFEHLAPKAPEKK